MKLCVCVALLAVVPAVFGDSWSYQTQDTWHLLPGNQCNGNSQSPINIISSIAITTDLGPFVLDGYTDENTNMDLVNNGRGVAIQLHEEVEDLYKLSGGGLPTTYTAVQFHFHWGSINSQGSEHLIDGTSYPAEMHMIHYDKSKYANGPAALASSQWDAVTLLVVMIEVGESNTAFDPFLSYISQIANYSSGNTSLGQGNLPSFPIRNVLPTDLSKFYRYNGSKALPNCDESIIYNIFKDPISISQAQLDMFRTLYGDKLNAQGNYKIVDNYRYIQPLNGRKIYYSSHVQLPSHQ
ncbi:carbonic anhydrase 1-like [Strongylocentrotus purpuratus]|uniref:Carbonic anhydrase n=1 Tax=Strongylocentrotus purpuratus TaxID=7668 RepID=A0A7M7LTT1_STRPU|nr:carbonic anhydrase 1-like [Strongylocentrotus purpuratus]|eukprot:XP_011679839.1 PREDICTED: carbonic anhydrase 1-like [Strongylocentrotus purpuratus]